MTSIIEDYLHEVEGSLRADGARKRQIVDELRTHLTEKVDEERRAQPDRPIAEIEQEVLREFGNPRELALAYEPDGPVLRNSAGDIVLRVGSAMGRGAAAVGRGTARALKWVAIAMAALLVIAVGVGAWAYHEVKPYIPAIVEDSRPTYTYYQECQNTPCSGQAPADSFFIHPDARSVRFAVQVFGPHPDDAHANMTGNHTLHLTVSDPSGTIRFDRNITTDLGSSYEQETSWNATSGNWTVSYGFDGFQGWVNVRAYSLTFPFGK